jgi:hypothetical protein
VVNFSGEPARTRVGHGHRLLFETESGVELHHDGTLRLPPHAGALLAPGLPGLTHG